MLFIKIKQFLNKMEDEIDLIIKDDDEKTYILEVQKRIKYIDLKELIKKKINKKADFDVIYKNKKYEKVDEILNLNQGDMIYLESNVFLENFTPCQFHQNINLNEADMKVEDLSGILLICLLKYIASKINDLNQIKNGEIREIIKELMEGMQMTDKPQEDIKALLSQNKGNNILTYINYIKEIIKVKDILNLINLFDENTKKQINSFWSVLSKYQDFNILFEKEFSKMIEKSYFDYSLVSISIFQHERRKEFIENLQKCDNCEVKYLLHGTEIESISKIITSDFKYTKKAFYGMGIYFSDMIDYISFYSERTESGGRTNWKKIIPVGKTISCVGTEIYYNRDKKKYIYDDKYYVPTLDHFPSHEELEDDYKDKMVPKDGIHFVRVEPTHGHVLKSESDIEQSRKEGKFIGTEYVITEMEQILPLYGLTLRRNEYFILWRDGNFKGKNEWSDYLKQRKMFIYKEAKMNVFFESNTEKALELVKRKKYNKIILISSCQGDVGKKFVDIVRKILGFDIVVLFYSANKGNLKWIEKYDNALYTNNEDFYKKYITNYNIDGLNKLKNEMNNYYKCNLKLNNDCLKYPKFVEKKNYDELLFEEINPHFRKVVIKNKNIKKALIMENGIPKFNDFEGKEIEKFYWYITIINEEITLFSNDLYLSIDNNNNNIKGSEWMTNWKYEQKNSKYLFYYKDKNNVLTLDGNNARLESQNSKKFQYFDIFDINF